MPRCPDDNLETNTLIKDKHGLFGLRLTVSAVVFGGTQLGGEKNREEEACHLDDESESAVVRQRDQTT